MKVFDKEVSRLFLGSSLYPSPQILEESLQQSKTNVVTMSLRRSTPQSTHHINFLKNLNVNLLPNTAGCMSVKEAVTTAQMSREIFNTSWIKLEIVTDMQTLHPHGAFVVEASKILVSEGFDVFPYISEDLSIAHQLANLGLKVLMPWAAPIGSNQGLRNPKALMTLRNQFPDHILVIDAGIGRPSHACYAMELGMDAVLLNTAVAEAKNPASMARAFQMAITSGRQAFLSGLSQERNFSKSSTPTAGIPFWHS